MKKAQIKRSWVVYPPNYVPGDGYHKIRFLEKAWNKACSLGVGSALYETVEQTRKDGSISIKTGEIYEVCRP